MSARQLKAMHYLASIGPNFRTKCKLEGTLLIMREYANSERSKMIEENIIDPSLREWFMPAFSTTTKSDQATASIIMMSTMQKYFSFGCGIQCGLPSVTLQGQKKDWEKMLGRLERLKSFGDEPTMWYELLRPVFTKFVETFDDPESEAIKDFWQKIVHRSGGGSGPRYLSGKLLLHQKIVLLG
jgi:Domain of unknown function (DUF4419)